MIRPQVFAIIIVLSAAELSGQLVQFRVEARNSDGGTISQAILREQFDLNVWVRDVRPEPKGVVSAYLDVVYNDSLASVTPNSLKHGPDFGAISKGDINSPPLLNEVGSLANGFLDIPPLPPQAGGDEQLLFTVGFQADALGTVSFDGNPADGLPRHATTILGFDDAVPLDQMQFVNLSLEVILAPPDTNNDNRLDCLDVDAVSTTVANSQYDFRHDLSGDGIVDQRDIDSWLEAAAESNGFSERYLTGDANLDGEVNAADLNALGLQWQESAFGWCSADFDASGFVNAVDLNLLGLNWRQQIAPAAASAVSVPEPSGVFLAVILLLCLPLSRRFKDIAR